LFSVVVVAVVTVAIVVVVAVVVEGTIIVTVCDWITVAVVVKGTVMVIVGFGAGVDDVTGGGTVTVVVAVIAGSVVKVKSLPSTMVGITLTRTAAWK